MPISYFQWFSAKISTKLQLLTILWLAKYWKDMIKFPSLQESAASTIDIDELSCRTVYRLLISSKNLPSPTSDSRLTACGFDSNKRRLTYLLPFRVTKGIKLAIFGIKSYTLCTNNLLYKMNKISSPGWPFCSNVKQTSKHLFVDCPLAVSFNWSEYLLISILFARRKPSSPNMK